MPATLTVPTVFTAVDRFSRVVGNMAKSVTKFTRSTGSQFLRFNQRFNQFFKLDDAKRQLLSYASTAALVGALVSGVVFSGKSLIDYEKNVSAVHGLLNQLSDKDFKPFQKAIDDVAKQTQYSAVEVASSFAKIAELNVDLVKTPESVSAVSKAAITLSRAASMELTPATESLVGIMAQFQLKGTDANRVINTLAAGLKYGSASILDQTEAYKNWGTVAHSANLTIEQATALTQTLGKYQLKGAEAGTALRGTIIRMQKAHLGYASGLFNVNDALAEANKHYNKLAKARDKDNYLIKLFGIRQITAGRILLQNTDLINSLTKAVTNTNQANEQARINTDNVAGAWQRLRDQFINYITSSDKGKEGMVRVKNVMKYLADNMDRVLDISISIVKWFLIFKTTMWAVAGAIKLFNLYNAASAAVSATATAATAAQTVTVGGFGSAIAGVTTELGAANIAATGFFATLSEFVIPAALVALGGLAIWKVLNHPKWEDGTMAGDDWNKPKYFNPKTPDGLISPFSNKNEENDYQSWFLKSWKAKGGPYKGGLERIDFYKQFGSKYDMSSKWDMNALKNLNKDDKPVLPVLTRQPRGDNNNATTSKDSTVHIFLHDPNGNVKDVKHTGSGNINVQISSTQGAR